MIALKELDAFCKGAVYEYDRPGRRYESDTERTTLPKGFYGVPKIARISVFARAQQQQLK